VEHESRVHIDIETDDIPAEVARLEALGAYSSPSLPPIPRQSCHPFQAKAATGSSEACHPLTG
jgi:hypothetical protein